MKRFALFLSCLALLAGCRTSDQTAYPTTRSPEPGIEVSGATTRGASTSVIIEREPASADTSRESQQIDPGTPNEAQGSYEAPPDIGAGAVETPVHDPYNAHDPHDPGRTQAEREALIRSRTPLLDDPNQTPIQDLDTPEPDDLKFDPPPSVARPQQAPTHQPSPNQMDNPPADPATNQVNQGAIQASPQTGTETARPQSTADQALNHRIRMVLTTGPIASMDSSNLQVTSRNGAVTLKGSVPSESAKKQIEDQVKRIPGVDSVQNELTVQKP